MDSNDGLRNLEPMAFYGSPRSRWQVWALVLSVLTTPFCVLLLGIATDSTALSSTEQRSYLVMGGGARHRGDSSLAKRVLKIVENGRWPDC